jgi:hypothetical protein
MSSNLQKQNGFKGFKHSASAEGIVIKRLKDLGFLLKENQLSFSESHFKSRIDLLFHRGRKEYAVEVKYSRKIQLALSHLLPRGILLLQAAKRLRNYIPIVAVVVEKLDQRDIHRMADFMRHFAPEVGWLIVDEYGSGAFQDPEKDEHIALQQFNRQPPVPVSLHESDYSFSAQHPRQLSFSDLDQWLLKVFLLGHPGIVSDYWGGPQGIVQNAFQLSKLSGVSPPVANSWFNAMESSGYLKRIGRRKAMLLKPNDLIEEWRGQYRFGDNRIMPYRSMYPVSEDDQYFHDLFGKIKSCNEDAVPLAISGHQACNLLGIKHSSAKSIHIYFWGNIGLVANSLDLVPAKAAHDSNVFLVEPKYPRSVFGGRVAKQGIPICDILQSYLDLFNLPDRGREQADFIYQNIVSKIFEKARSN